MADTYTGYLDVKPTPELNPYLVEASFVFCGDTTTWHSALCVDTADFYAFARDQSPETPTIRQASLTLPGKYILPVIRNDGDEAIEAKVVFSIDEGSAFETDPISLSAGQSGTTGTAVGIFPSSGLTVGSHTISWTLQARVAGGTWNNYYSGSTTYTVQAPASGDITKVEVDGSVLPEGGTLDWTRNVPVTIKVYFKNVGGEAGSFTISTTDETGATLCTVTTDSVPADGIEYYVDCCTTTCPTFTPTEVKKKTLTVSINP